MRLCCQIGYKKMATGSRTPRVTVPAGERSRSAKGYHFRNQVTGTAVLGCKSCSKPSPQRAPT